MEKTPLLVLGDGLIVDQVIEEVHQFIVLVRSTIPASCCPLCGDLSAFIHSQYQRCLADVPCAGRAVRLHLTVRRFSCHNAACARAIFTERLPHLTQPHAQMTKRLRETLCLLGIATCAEKTARLAPQLGMKGSASTVLRCQRAAPDASPEPFTKIGIDDFAFRRGRTYGTIIVNLETHRLIDLLPDRTVETVSAWLTAHPEIELISRDRASDYATAATIGAPQAIQVCDRWHLMKNLSESVVTFLARMRAQIRQASAEQAPPREEDPEEVARWKERETSQQARDERKVTRQARKTSRDQIRETHQAERLDRYQQILQLASQGLSSNDIAARVGLSARSVRQWLTEGIKTSPRRRRPSPLDTYASYLRKRWEEGEQRGVKLYQELLEKGYTGSERGPSLSGSVAFPSNR